MISTFDKAYLIEQGKTVGMQTEQQIISARSACYLVLRIDCDKITIAATGDAWVSI